MTTHLYSLDDPQLDAFWQQNWQAGAWLTIGAFDGVHRGHQAILRRLTRGAHAQGAPAVVLTFHPHPSVVLGKRSGALYLSTPEQRAELMHSYGVDLAITQTFTPELAHQTARQYMQRLSERLHLRHLLIGHDFALGRGREGTLPVLRSLGQELGYSVNVMAPVRIAGEVVSSSRIRAALAAGDVRLARHLLGRPYRVSGPVDPGDGRGRTIGIPTANLTISPETVLPLTGVYACLACVDGCNLRAVTNIGLRPTFTGGEATPRLETHLLDYSGDLYGKTVQVAFLARLRDEMRFASVDELLTQIQADIVRARRLLRNTGSR